MIEYLGSRDGLALFSNGELSAVVDTNLNMVVEFGVLSNLQNHDWSTEISVTDTVFDLALASLVEIENSLTASAGRMYTIPDGVKAEAVKALKWRKEEGRGGTPVGLNTARILSKGGQIGIKKVRHIAKYFPRHEVDKRGKGWNPGEDNFPSNGRIAWALWGGDAAWRWASAIVERENKSITAGGYDNPEYMDHLDSYDDNYDSEMNAFKSAQDLDSNYGPEFLVRVCLDGSGIDRLYKVEIDGHVYVWDDCSWDDLGHVDGDIYTYDSSLDNPYDRSEKTHILIDPSSAVVVSALLQERPFDKIQLEDIDSLESRMMADLMPDLDYEMIDRVITAAIDPNDSVDTPEERAQRAQKQPRDAGGKFAKAGNRVVVGGDASRGSGVITKVNANDGTVDVKLDSGKQINVDAKQTKAEEDSKPAIPPVPTASDATQKQFDSSGILGEPQTNQNKPKAKLPEGTRPLDKPEIDKMFTDWAKSVEAQRAKNKSAAVTSAATPEKDQTPATSDVTPKYLAIVSPDDPQAVMDMVALVPKTTTTTTPLIYKRVDKKWVPDPQILLDLKSPTPPPVVQLDTKDLINNILKQVDGIENVTTDTKEEPSTAAVSASVYQQVIDFWTEDYKTLLAAGGLDRNRGNAEQLRHYWTRGKGALKIRWGQPGDWKRCVRHLAKYLGVRAKGYCQLRHKEATGMYTSTHAKLDRQRRNLSSNEFIMEEVWGENIGTPTYIEDKDLLMPIEDIISEHDDLYDSNWEPDEETCRQLEELAKCGDSEFEALIAAGGLDKNRGKAEELRHYWTRGVGGAKIMWGTPGDWTRCVRHLSKYMGPRAKGYCQLRHKEMTGVWTGSRFNVGKNRGNFSSMYSSDEEFTSKVVEKSALVARANDAKEKFGLVAGANKYLTTGSKFTIPLLLPENLESGDGRKFNINSVTFRDLPLPLLWQIKTGDGHMGSVVVGRIDYMERIPNGIGNAYGVFDTGPYGKEAERLVKNGFIRGVSADLDQFEAKEDKKLENSEKEDDEVSKQKLTINHARVMAATIVAKPAFQECTISIDENNQGNQEDEVIPDDGIYEESIDSFVSAEALTASGFLESEIPMTPPETWFHNPGLTKPTPITVDPDGRIYGHIAAWHVNHIGLPRSTKPPRSRSNYAYFHTGVCRTDTGKDIPVGQLTLAGGHAPLNMDAVTAAKHYDDTASAIADVHAGEDDYGIWVAGSLRPNANEMQIRALRASAPSGDWRPINGGLELVAVCQVNVPGFPIARAMVASGKVMALVAAGASYFAIMKSQHVTSLVDRAAKLNELSASSADVMSRFEAQFGYVSREKRESLAKEGKAMKDGSFPIRNIDDLKNAIKAHGRAKDIEAAKKHIIKRARALGKYDLIPQEWKGTKTIAASAQVDDLRSRALMASALAEFAKFSPEERDTLAKSGEALPDGSYPIRNESDLKNAIHAYGRSNPEDRAKVRKHIIKRARALKKMDVVPEEWTVAASITAAANLDRMRYVLTSIAAAGDAPVDGEISDEDLKKLADAKAEADKQTAEEIKIAEDIKAGKTTVEDKYDEQGRVKYTPKTQPRDARGKYRKVLARLRQDLGVAGLQDALNKVQSAENLEFAGNYEKSANASSELLNMIDRLDAKALNPKALENVQNTARELGRVIANLPLPFGEEAQKLRFSDLPSGLRDLIQGMMDRVESKIGKKDADIANANLKSYMSGADVYSQGEIQSEMSKMLRLLT